MLLLKIDRVDFFYVSLNLGNQSILNFLWCVSMHNSHDIVYLVDRPKLNISQARIYELLSQAVGLINSKKDNSFQVLSARVEEELQNYYETLFQYESN